MERECDKGSKIWHNFLFLFSNKLLVFRAGIHEMLIRIAIREDPDLGLAHRCQNINR